MTDGSADSLISTPELLTIRLDEMELLETAYPEVVFDAPDPRPLLRAALAAEETHLTHDDGSSVSTHRKASTGPGGRLPENNPIHEDLKCIPQVCFRCPMSPGHGQLRIRLPRRYPEDPLVVTVEGTPQLSASTREAITAAARDEALRLSGEARREPHCLQVLGEALRVSAENAMTTATGVVDFPPASATPPSSAETRLYGSSGDSFDSSTGSSGRGHLPANPGIHPPSDKHSQNPSGARVSHRHTGRKGEEDCERGHDHFGEQGALLLGRRLIYSHHIIAPQKRTGIIQAARELDLGGFSKVGWPGVIVIEGEETSCEEFVKTLRGWRWKHLAVRGEQTNPVPHGRSLDDERLLPRPLEELGEKDGVSAIAARCREAGLGELFETLLR